MEYSLIIKKDLRKEEGTDCRNRTSLTLDAVTLPILLACHFADADCCLVLSMNYLSMIYYNHRLDDELRCLPELEHRGNRCIDAYAQRARASISVSKVL